ncbi:MAG: TIGR03620 family F420-dependent LLM class oxidoreductase [Chloroflexi bacterium]|nr:TIGR03620 family F420-dependent LLM class oxidoreductase [Chloroflexota bacterium]
MTTRQDTLRAALGRIGVWSFGLQANRAVDEQTAVSAYEGVGYTATWFPESIGSKEALAHAALLLAASPRMVIATGIASIYARDAAAMISGARTLAEAYPGRFVLGIGVSHAPSVAARGGTYGRPVETMTSYLDAMDAAAWAGPALPERPPVILAALGPRMLDLAAERTDGAHPYFVPVEHTRFARERLGRDPVLAVELTAVLDPDPARARETARAFATRYLAAVNYANNLRRLGWSDEDIAGGGSDRLLDAVIAQGNAAAIASRVREHLDAGADHVCVQVRSMDPADLCLEAYSELRDALGEVAV